MKCNREIRQQAWTVVRSQWLWRLLTVGLVLNGISQVASWALGRMFQDAGAQSWADYWVMKVKALQSGLDCSVPSLRLAGEMTGVTLCQSFVAYVFAAILAFGFAGVALKATRNEGERWFVDSFEGFRRPLELAWLLFLVNLRVFLWSLLLIVPGVIAAYRYRQAWYLKNEHLDWSAGKCLHASAVMMKGYKWRAFLFDLSYCGWVFLVVLLVGAGLVLPTSGNAVLGAVGSLAGAAGVLAMMFLLCYFFVGRAAFYRELATGAEDSSVS